MGKALEGVRILDFTHVQSVSDLHAASGLVRSRRDQGGKARDRRRHAHAAAQHPNADSLYFTMLNHNKRSITLDTKNPTGKTVLEELVKSCDVLVENFAPGVLDRMGFSWNASRSSTRR